MASSLPQGHLHLLTGLVFGFPITAALPVDQRNLGMYDQRFALQWVQDNIGAFGGDPSQVTLFGQSAGAFAVDALITSNASNFHAAIMESGVYAYLYIPPYDNTYDAPFRKLAAALNCTGDDATVFTCMKNYPNATEIRVQEEANNITMPKAYDERTLVSDPRTRLETNRTRNVPVILGSNTMDGSYYSWIFTIGAPGNAAYYAVSRLNNNQTLRLLVEQEYGMKASNTQAQNATILELVDTDWFFHCVSLCSSFEYLLTRLSLHTGMASSQRSTNPRTAIYSTPISRIRELECLLAGSGRRNSRALGIPLRFPSSSPLPMDQITQRKTLSPTI
jgi:carboxylesterase type B